MIRKKISRVERAPRVSSGIRIQGDMPQNQKHLVSGETYPDRTALTPLVLQPYVSYTDGTTGRHVDNALPEVTDGCWYRLTPDNRSLGLCEATKISVSLTGTDSDGNQISVFSIVSTPGASDYGRLTVRENVPPGERYTYVFEGTLATDGRILQMRFNTKCDAASEVPDIQFDNNPTALYDPLHGEQFFTINPSLSFDLPVTWKWKSFHELEGGWVDLCSTQLDWCIDKVGDGIKIDRKRMPDAIILRCIAEVTVEDATVTLEKTVTHTRMMPRLDSSITRVGEITEDVDVISPYALIRTGSEVVTDLSEIDVRWLSSSGTEVGTGLNPSIPLSRIPDMMLDLDVRDKGGFAAIVSDGKLIVDGDALLVTRSKI